MGCFFLPTYPRTRLRRQLCLDNRSRHTYTVTAGEGTSVTTGQGARSALLLMLHKTGA